MLELVGSGKEFRFYSVDGKPLMNFRQMNDVIKEDHNGGYVKKLGKQR